MSNVPMYSPVNEHVTDSSLSSEKKINVPAPANGVIVQALGQNVRVKLSGNATSGQGFRITAGADPVLLPVGAGSISVQEESATATLEYQFVRVHGLGA